MRMFCRFYRFSNSVQTLNLQSSITNVCMPQDSISATKEAHICNTLHVGSSEINSPQLLPFYYAFYYVFNIIWCNSLCFVWGVLVVRVRTCRAPAPPPHVPLRRLRAPAAAPRRWRRRSSPIPACSSSTRLRSPSRPWRGA